MLVEPSEMSDGTKRVVEAVTIAGLSALCVKLIEWGLDEVKKRVTPPKDDDKSDAE